MTAKLDRAIEQFRAYLTDELAELRRDSQRIDAWTALLHARGQFDRLFAEVEPVAGDDARPRGAHE